MRHYMRKRRTGDPALTLPMMRATSAKIVKLEAENAELRELLGQMRQQRDAWHDIALRMERAPAPASVASQPH